MNEYPEQRGVRKIDNYPLHNSKRQINNEIAARVNYCVRVGESYCIYFNHFLFIVFTFRDMLRLINLYCLSLPSK